MSFKINKNSILKTHKNEIIIAIFSTLISSVLTLLIAFRNEDISVADLVSIFVNITIFGILCSLLFSFRRYIAQNVQSINDLLSDYFGYDVFKNDFYRRKRHFAIEKQNLAFCLTEKVLPSRINELVSKKQKETGYYNNINIILDAGSTIAALFCSLIEFKLEDKKIEEKIKFYTNNLAGLDELQKRQHSQSTIILNQDNVNVLSGHPLHNYRAITGKETLASVERIDPENKDITIGIVTGNWIMAGDGLDKIKICARGAGHLEFKRKVIEESDLVIIVCPLAKIIRCDDLNYLNEIKPYSDHYTAYEIPQGKREHTFLLTTLRHKESLSPLRNITMGLENVMLRQKNKNYILCDECEPFEPDGNDKKKVMNYEFPHRYVRESIDKLYGVVE